MDERLANFVEDIDDEIVDIERLPPTSFFSFFNIFKRSSRLAVPIALSFTFSFQMVCLVFFLLAGSDDENEAASVTLIVSIISTLEIMGVSPMFAVGILTNLLLGQISSSDVGLEIDEKREQITSLWRNSAYFVPLASVPIITSMYYSGSILKYLGQGDETAEFTEQFLSIYAWSMPAHIFRVMAEQFIVPMGHVKSAIYMSWSTFSVCTVLAAWLEFGGLGLQPLGTSGVAAAYVAESCLTAALFNAFLAYHKDFSHYDFFHFWQRIRGSFKQIKALVKLGLPISLTAAASLSASLVTSIFAGLLGSSEQTSWSLVVAMSYFFIIFGAAFAQSNTQLFSKCIGRGEHLYAYKLGIRCILTEMIYLAPPVCVLSIMPELVAILPINMKDNVRLIIDDLKILLPLAGVEALSSAVLLSLFRQCCVMDAKGKAAACYVGGLSAGVALSYFLGVHTKLGINGVGIGFAGGSLISLVAVSLLWGYSARPEKLAQSQRPSAEPRRFCLKSNLHLCLFGKRAKNDLLIDESMIELPTYGAMD